MVGTISEETLVAITGGSGVSYDVDDFDELDSELWYDGQPCAMRLAATKQRAKKAAVYLQKTRPGLSGGKSLEISVEAMEVVFIYHS